MALYRLQQVTVTEEPASVVGTPVAAGSESARVAGAQARAALRLRGQRDTLRPNAEFAEALVFSQAAVKTHVNRIFYKIGSRDRAQAVRYAYQHGIA